eukprot:COSAG01_NODE_21497_length_899_cov_2.292500_2_plen_104_part_00
MPREALTVVVDGLGSEGSDGGPRTFETERSRTDSSDSSSVQMGRTPPGTWGVQLGQRTLAAAHTDRLTAQVRVWPIAALLCMHNHTLLAGTGKRNYPKKLLRQ